MLSPKLLDKHLKFYSHIRDCCKLTTDQLIAVANEKRNSPVYRAAAVRVLTCTAEISVTLGQPYGWARRLTRSHYQV